MQRIIQTYYLSWLSLLLPGMAMSQITRKVYDEDGKQQAIAHITVKAYGMSDAGKMELISQTQSDAQGNYSLNVPEGKRIKVLFEDGSKKWQSGRSTPTVRFVQSPANDINWAGSQAGQYVSARPFTVAPVYINGKGNDTLSALVAIPVDSEHKMSGAGHKIAIHLQHPWPEKSQF